MREETYGWYLPSGKQISNLSKNGVVLTKAGKARQPGK
jgi:hypothetical protein